MKQTPTFKMGEPSYLTVASTAGNESPTARTVSKVPRACARGIAAGFGVRGFIAAILAEVAPQRE